MPQPTKEYHRWIKELKERIRSAQIKAAIKVNTELLNLYWELGKEIIEKEKETQWGSKLIPQLSKDLLAEFPDINGFSRSNLYYIRKWYLFYTGPDQIVPQVAEHTNSPDFQSIGSIVQQLVGQPENKPETL